MEACRIAIMQRAPGIFDVGAPMRHKPLCYEILKDARIVIAATEDSAFRPDVTRLVIVMGMKGTVDVAAPLPPRLTCEAMLIAAKDIIERYDDAQAPVVKPFAAELMGT